VLVIGSATSVSIILGMVRVKVLAFLLGPVGVGLIGIYANILETGVQFAGLGLGQSGVRRIAASQGDPDELAQVRCTLVIAHLVQGALGMAGIWLLRGQISLWMFNDPGYGFEVGVLGLGVLLSLFSVSQNAQLQGMGCVDELAQAGVIAAVLTTAGGITAVWVLGGQGLVLFVLAQPVFMVIVTARYVARLPQMSTRLGLAVLWTQWREMAGLGLIFMFAGLLATTSLLVARAVIVDSMGLSSAGHFQAAWTISIQYLAFLLNAMAIDYFPRLSAIIGNRIESTALINHQAQLSLALGGPLLLILLGLAPWVIAALYSGAFEPAVAVLQWQCLGNVLKLASWPTDFAIIARQDRVVFAAIQILWNLVFLGLLWVLLPTMGVKAAGVAFAVAYGAFILINNVAVWQLHDFRWQSLSLRLFGLHLGLSASLLVLAQAAPLIGAVVGVVAGAATGIWGLRVVALRIGPEGRLGRLAAGLFTFLHWPLPVSDYPVSRPETETGV
jgi:PST family polysaccharide transporter